MADEHPDVIDQLRAVLRCVADETTFMWETGRLDPDGIRSAVTEDFVGTQYAPWFDGGVFTAGRNEWLAGTAEAAELYKGQGIRWEIDSIVIAPRGDTEAAVAYRVNHLWPDDRPPSRALFLETWVTREGRWLLRRHTSEKA